ncbi:MAG: DUF3592 domain-containing protein [Pseudomonadota bacterium]
MIDIFGNIFIGAIGLAFLVVGLRMRNKENAKHARMIPAQVRVNELIKVRGSSGGDTFAPVYEIMDGPHKGKTHKSEFGSNPPTHKVGDETEGRYDPSTGEILSLKQTNRTNLVASGVAAVGAAVVIAAIFGMFGLGPMASGL